MQFTGDTSSLSAISDSWANTSCILLMPAPPCENMLIASPQASIGHTSIVIYWLKATKRPMVISPFNASHPPYRSVRRLLMPITTSRRGMTTASIFAILRFFSFALAFALAKARICERSRTNDFTTRTPEKLSCTKSVRSDTASCRSRKRFCIIFPKYSSPNAMNIMGITATRVSLILT